VPVVEVPCTYKLVMGESVRRAEKSGAAVVPVKS
jgi:hypothetical protein